MISLENKTVLITGAAGGMGQALMAAFEGLGARVAGADLSYRAPAFAQNRLTVGCDVADAASVKACVDAVAERWGGVDILVNNAGIFPFSMFDDLKMDVVRKVFAINVEGVILMTQACLPHMKQQKWGRIINVGSNTFHMGWPGLSHYTASKGAVIGLTRGLSTELGEFGITVNVVSPTVTHTPGNAALFETAPEVITEIVDRQAIRRQGTAQDVAKAAILLATDEAAFITGQTISADGGLAKL